MIDPRQHEKDHQQRCDGEYDQSEPTGAVFHEQSLFPMDPPSSFRIIRFL